MTERAESTAHDPMGDGDGRATHRWYRTLVDTVAGGVFRLDADDRIVEIDDTLLELTGHDRETLRGEHVSRLVAGSDVEELVPTGGTDRRTESGSGTTSTASLERPIRTATGETVPCELRLGAVPADDGPAETVGIVRALESCESAADATTDRSIESVADGASEPGPPFDPITAALEEADVGVFVLDDEFDVAWINTAIERYFGLEQTDVVGRDKRELIEETIRERVAEPDRFVEIVGATYDDNSGSERFECHVTPGENRAERWLEHRSKPIDAGPYAGGRIELYYDVTEQHRRAYQLRRLNEAVREWLGSSSREAVAEQACRHLFDILDLEINGVFLHDPEADVLEPVAWSEPAAALFDEIPTFAAEEGIVWRVFETGEPATYDDITGDSNIYNPETPIRSEICLPIGDHGIVMIGSEDRGAFDDGDLSLAKIVASSLEVTFDRIDHERTLERERGQTAKLLQTAPVAISVEDADGESVLANRHAQTMFGLGHRDPLGETELLAELNVRDADGEPVPPEDGPSARVRATGEAVANEELELQGPTGERRGFLIPPPPRFRARRAPPPGAPPPGGAARGPAGGRENGAVRVCCFWGSVMSPPPVGGSNEQPPPPP